jgi:hypothetical protein
MQDKGGDPETFRTTQASWEVLRDLFDRNKVQKGTFTSYLGVRTAPARQTNDDDDNDEDEDMTMISTKNIPRNQIIHPINTTKMQRRKRCRFTKWSRRGAIGQNVRNARPIFQGRAFASDRSTKMQGRMGGGFILIVGACR